MLQKIASRSQTDVTDPVPYYFIHLINALRGLSQSELRDLYQTRIKNMKERYTVIDDNRL